MAVYAVGDVQGCHNALRRLLATLHFDPAADSLWLTGDLVNRGPDSIATLRFVRELGDAAVCVLGNHDLHLLALAQRDVSARPAAPTLDAILAADDSDELLDWLRARPLAHYDADLNTLMVHAGVVPEWNYEDVLRYAAEVEVTLRGDNYGAFLGQMYGSKPRRWRDDLTGMPRLRFIVNCLTRIRMLRANGSLDFDHKGPPGRRAAGLQPWYAADGARWAGSRVIFGHWSALGYVARANYMCLDSGCVWGRQMTAVRLDAAAPPVQVHCDSQGEPQD